MEFFPDQTLFLSPKISYNPFMQLRFVTSGLHMLTSFTWNLRALQFYHNTSFHSFIRHQNITFIYKIFLSHCENNNFLLSGCVTFGMWSHLWAMKNKLTLVWEEKTERKTILIRSQKTSVCSDTIRNASHTCTGFYARLYETQASLKSKSTFELFMFQVFKSLKRSATAMKTHEIRLDILSTLY